MLFRSDKELIEKLKAEDEGILVWLIQGALLYREEGLTPPEEVTAVTREYFQEEDSFGRWLATLKQCGPREGTQAAVLLSQFLSWLRGEGLLTDVWNQTNFSAELKKRGIESEKHGVVLYGLTGGVVIHRGVDPATLGFGQGPVPPGMIPTPASPDMRNTPQATYLPYPWCTQREACLAKQGSQGKPNCGE